MLRCPARISSGWAWAIAFSAASRSPRLIASSTLRTAPRIWVRRDLLITVRRAILRVAFLAEVVLAIVSNSLRVSPASFSRIGASPALRAWSTLPVFRNVPARAACRSQYARRRQLHPKKQRRRDCTRRHRRPYRGRVLERQRFPARGEARNGRRKTPVKY